MEALKAPLRKCKQFSEIIDYVAEENTPVHVSGLGDVERCYFMDGIGDNSKYRLIVTYSDQRARDLYEKYRFFDKEVYVYPAKDLLFYSADIHGNTIAKQRLEVIETLATKKSGTVILTIDALLDRLPKKEEFIRNVIEIKDQDTIDIYKLTETLVEFGYEKNDWVNGAGQFAVRGGIIDIYPLTGECPYRIELWGEDVDSIRSFDVESQRSIEKIEELIIYPATEIVLSKDRIEKGLKKICKEHKEFAASLKKTFKTEEYARINKAIDALKEELIEFNAAIGIDSYINYFYDEVVSFLDYFDESTFIYIDEPAKVLERAEGSWVEFSESMKGRLEGGYILPGQANVLYDYNEILAKLNFRKTVIFSYFGEEIEQLTSKKQVFIEGKSVTTYNNSFDLLTKDIVKWKKDKYRIVVVSPSVTRGKRLVEDLRDRDIVSFYMENADRALEPTEVLITTGRLSNGFRIDDMKLVVISESDIFSVKSNRRKRKKPIYTGEKINSFADISVGDYVVHERHGLGIYKGIEKIEVDKIAKDYICIEYKGGSKLFILASQLDAIQKYSSAEGRAPKLNRLGGTEWEKTKTRVKGQVKEIAKELVELYAIRQSKEGYQYSKDSIWQKEFEEMFPYEETDDQDKAISETKSDMESKKIMDRLICGDVGFGKTEVAIRAAFKAVGDSKQVAYLVPTTILAQQHYATFLERMKNYPITVKMLSRFCTPKEQREIIEGLKSGQVDIVIGTHKLLSKSIDYKNLGLLVIDEEQRFGVSHKEKIKQLKKDIDVLTLTATPIPRTLHMSLIGIRDMSLLEEPPVDRRAIQTYVLEYNKELIREAINRELARGGQVYYVYNRVNNIEEITNQLKDILPDARITFAHGQMKERELENIMYQFINKEIDVLVTTTIIETGLDIANANTMIIHDADKFGLSQLYQLRGRVGRSNRSAYAFLMYKRDTMLKETAEKRLKAIREFTDLGSGYKIAMRDLEIRGAGNLLGADQSGHMEAVGYDLYCRMLNDAVKEEKGEAVMEDFDTVIDLPVDAYIPATYVKNEFVKLELYKRISQISNHEDYDDIIDEITDRFGDMPQVVYNLINISLMKAMAKKVYVTEISKKTNDIKITMYPKAKVNADKVNELLDKYKGKMKIIIGMEPIFTLDTKDIITKDLLICVQNVINDLNVLLEK